MRFGVHDIRHWRFAHNDTSIRGLVCSVLSLQHKICVLQVMTERCGNLATRLRVGLLCSMIQLSLLSGWPRQSMDEATMQVDLVPLTANFASGVDPCAGIKLFLRLTAHPQILALELQAPMGACPGQYSKYKYTCRLHDETEGSKGFRCLQKPI